MVQECVCVCVYVFGTALGRMAGSHAVTQRDGGALATSISVGEMSLFL